MSAMCLNTTFWLAQIQRYHLKFLLLLVPIFSLYMYKYILKLHSIVLYSYLYLVTIQII